MLHAHRRDPEERDLRLVAEALRRVLKERPTKGAFSRLAKAAMGEYPDPTPT